MRWRREAVPDANDAFSNVPAALPAEFDGLLADRSDVLIPTASSARTPASNMNYPLKYIDGMTTFVENRLKEIGIRTTEKLLAAAGTVKGRKKLAQMTGVEEHQWLDWANNADVMRIKGLGSELAKLLRRAGVTTVGDLSLRNPTNLVEKMVQANDKHKLTRSNPTEKSVGLLIERAKKLPRRITY
jgi:predicted flap endonuclease-1-like 5' DNA nuclease